jgi:hypothetical protein
VVNGAQIQVEGEWFVRLILEKNLNHPPPFGGGLRGIQSRQDRDPPGYPATNIRRRDIDPPACLEPVVRQS